MKYSTFLAALLFACSSALAGTPCEDVKAEIAAKLDAKQVASYSLDIVPNDQVGDGKVVGSCEGGTKKIVYSKK